MKSEQNQDPVKDPMDPRGRSRLPRMFGDLPTMLGGRPAFSPSEMEGLDVVFLGIPWEGTLTWGGFSGCELATKTIRQASARYGTYLPEYDLDAGQILSLGDGGDLAVTPGDPEKTMSAIRAGLAEVYSSGARPFIFGGDHSTTPEAVAALAERTRGRIGILHLDAHLDNMPEYSDDPFARCSPLHRIVNQEGVRNSSVVHFGIRGPRNSPFQVRLAKESGARLMTIREIRERGFQEALNEALDLVHQGTEAVFLTICSDILDAAHNPGGPPDFNGLTSGELMSLTYQTAARGIMGMDFVEVYPPQDPLNRSSHLAVWAFIHALVGIAADGS